MKTNFQALVARPVAEFELPEDVGRFLLKRLDREDARCL